MPAYPGNAQAGLINTNTQKWLWNKERVGAGASVAFQLSRHSGAYYPWGCSFELTFSANPGTFQVDIQTADSDEDGKYVTINALSGGLNATYTTRLELPSMFAKFVRGKVVTLTNDVLITILVTR